MMKFTVCELRKKLELVPDDTIVCIERVEDVYFDKHNWTTERIVFDYTDNELGVPTPYDYSDYFPAFSGTYIKDKNQLVILAHY